jgi:alcohol dehydrogenase (cytochrome c)
MMLGCLMVLGALPSSAQDATLPDGPGKEVVQRMCTMCHQLNVITPLRMSRDRWAATVNDMMSRGAQGTDQDVQTVVEYLATHFPRVPSSAVQAAPVLAGNASAGESMAEIEANLATPVGEANGFDGGDPPVVTSGVANADILNADKTPEDWLTVHGNYRGNQYSLLDKITPENASNLELKWVFQSRSNEIYETTPLVVKGVMYTVVGGGSQVVALDAKTGRLYWIYRHQVSSKTRGCCGQVNRGLAILGDTIYVGAADNHLIALDAKTGTQLWDKYVADPALGYSLTGAPLIVKDKVIIGIAGGEYGIRGFIEAFNVYSGKLEWRFYTTGGPEDPAANKTWAGDSWKHGGAPAWQSGNYDPDANLLYWGTGNPGPDYNGDVRLGDDLYSCTMLALNPDTGKLKWYYQANPNNETDWDAVEVPLLVDMNWQGQPRKVILWADRNGFFYVIDRLTGKPLLEKAFIDKQTWNAGFEPNGRPIMAANSRITAEGTPTIPDNQGATNWYNPSYSPRTGLFYMNARENYTTVFSEALQEYEEGLQYTGRGRGGGRPAPIPVGANDDKYVAVRAIDPNTGVRKWEFRLDEGTDLSTYQNWATETGAGGILTTASDLLITGERQGYVIMLDARSGKLVWRKQLGGQIMMNPMTYAVDGEQYIAVNAGTNLFVFGLKE